MRIEIYLWNQFKQTNTSQDLVVKTILVQLEAVAGYTVTWNWGSKKRNLDSLAKNMYAKQKWNRNVTVYKTLKRGVENMKIEEYSGKQRESEQ